MALTRPTIWDLDTRVEHFKDPLTTLHQGATDPDVDVGFIFNRANGLVSNVALYWSEAGNTFATAFTSNTGTTDTNVWVTSHAPITTGPHTVVGNIALTGNIVPTVTNTYSLGTPSSKWANVYVGPGSLYIQDTVTGQNAALTVTSNVLYVSGVSGLTNGNLYLNNNALLSLNPTVDITVGNVSGDSGNLVVYRTTNFDQDLLAAGNVHIVGNLTVTGKINTVPSTYGQFANVSTITATADNTARPILLNTTISNSGVRLGTGVSNSQIIVSKADDYRIEYNVGTSVSSGSPVLYFWLRKNGSDVPYSQISTTGTNNKITQVVGDYIVALGINDYVELYWAISNSSQAQLVATAAQTTPFPCPASPSVIVTVTPVSV